MEHNVRQPITPEALEDILQSPLYTPWIIADYEHWTLRLNTSDQSFLGRSYAWLKQRHVDRMSITELSEIELLELVQVVVPAYERVIRSWYPIDCINYEWLGNEVQIHRGHGHLHLFPRFSKPVTYRGRKFVDLAPGAQRKNEKLALPEVELRAILTEMQSRIDA